jgi:Fic-DOC domain mobile mystery protein B
VTKADLFEIPPGGTPLSPDEKRGLIPSFISTQGELNEAEQENIVKAEVWAFSRKRPLLTINALKNLHKQMYGDVWEWAGSFSQQNDRNIGYDSYRIEPALVELLQNVEYWIAHESWPPDEIAVRFHHKLTEIHPFPNGNGRFSRLAADMIIVSLGGERFTWGRGDIRSNKEIRRSYILALKEGDRHDIAPLLAFARSGNDSAG